jgi:multidrug efflux pump subunit AcrA (membrane-fusion protein)
MKTLVPAKYGNRALRIGAALLLAAALAAGCSAPGGPAQSAPAAGAGGAAQGGVKAETIAKRSMGGPREQVANVTAAVQLDVTAMAAGKVWSVLKKNGDRVEEGQVILRLDDKDASSQKEKAESSLRSAQQALAKAAEDAKSGRIEMENAIAKSEQQLKELEKDHNKARNDYDAGTLTKRQLEQFDNQVGNARRDLDAAKQKLAAMNKTNALAALESQVDAARLTLQDAQQALDEYNVKAPTTGVLTDMNAEVGMMIARGGKIGVVQKIDRVKIKTDLSEPAAKLARSKQELVFYSADNPSMKLKANVTYMASLTDAATKLYPLELEADNSNGTLKPGSRVQVQLTTPEEETVAAVPTLSIVREGGDTFLFVLKGDQAEKRKVKLGRLNGSYQEVLEGANAGEQLVVSGQHQLKDGQKVEVKPQ